MSDQWKQVRTLDTILLHTAVETRTVPYEAQERLECAICEGPIYVGDLFTLALATGFGRIRVPHCRNCRPFQVVGVKQPRKGSK